MTPDELAPLLPSVFRRALPGDTVLAAILDVMSTLHEPVESLLSQLDVLFDPRRTRDVLVPVLARWVDLERLYASEDAALTKSARLQDDVPIGRLRELVARSFMLSQMRGTARGLKAFLEIATGIASFTIEEPPSTDPEAAFHLIVHVPKDAEQQLPLIRRIIDSEKPAYTTYETTT
jgi:phage tail-like protein